jgi:pimeloyl-ACP methyl ester carboxylesterase
MRVASLVLAILTLNLASAVAAPQPFENTYLTRTHFREYTAPRADGSPAHFFASAPFRGPIVVYCEGSGCNSLFHVDKGRLRFGLYALVADLVPGTCVVSAEKRGVPFGHRGHGGTGIDCPPEYTKWATREQRVDDVCTMLAAAEEEMRANGSIPSHVIVIGHSEGAEVAAAVAARRPEVTHLAFLAGGGPSEMFDDVMLLRRGMAAQHKSPAEIENAVEARVDVFREILAHPNSTTRFFEGHAYRRWSGYMLHPPMDSLLACHAKLFIAQGGADQAVPVEATDLLAVELLRHGRRDVTLIRLPGADHGLRSSAGTDIVSVIRQSLQWAGLKTKSPG